jgi:hypothetical protein
MSPATAMISKYITYDPYTNKGCKQMIKLLSFAFHVNLVPGMFFYALTMVSCSLLHLACGIFYP